MATQAGYKISDPAELSTLKESDVARVGKDIYRRDLAKEQEAMKTWTGGRGTEASDLAFNTSVYAPTPAPTPTEPEIINKTSLQDNINNSLLNPDTKSNSAFIQGVSKFATGKPATAEDLAMEGSPLSDVVNKFGVGDKFSNFALNTSAPESVQKDNTTQQDNITQQNNAPDPVSAAIDKLIALKQGNMQNGVDLNSYYAKKQEAATAVEKSRQAIADKKLIDSVTLQQMADKPLLRSTIGIRQGEYSDKQYIDNLKMLQDYNNKLILSKMADGAYLEAQNITKDIANDNYEIAKLQIEKARNEQQINSDEAARLEKENEFQREMALKGYTYISDPKQLEPGGMFSGLKEDDIYRDPVSGRMYKKPVDDEILSISDAAALGVDYGTTKQQAIAMGLNPANVAAARNGGSSGKTIKVGNTTIPETGDTFTDTVNYLDALKKQGMLSDYAYKEQVHGLMEAQGYDITDEDAYNKISTEVNNSLHAKETGGTDVKNMENKTAEDLANEFLGETSNASDFITKLGQKETEEKQSKWLVDGKWISETILPDGWKFEGGILLDDKGKIVLDDNGSPIRN